MKKNNDGVRHYGYYMAILPFPDGEMICARCPMLHKESGFGNLERYTCEYKSGGIILYPMHERGDFCQLQYVGEDDPEVTE